MLIVKNVVSYIPSSTQYLSCEFPLLHPFILYIPSISCSRHTASRRRRNTIPLHAPDRHLMKPDPPILLIFAVHKVRRYHQTQTTNDSDNNARNSAP